MWATVADHDTWVRELERTRPSHATLATMFMGYEQRIVELQARLAEAEAERDEASMERGDAIERAEKAEAERDGWKLAAEHRGELHADALARLAAVEALHTQGNLASDCDCFDGLTDCPTLAAVRGEGDRPAECSCPAMTVVQPHERCPIHSGPEIRWCSECGLPLNLRTDDYLYRGQHGYAHETCPTR